MKRKKSAYGLRAEWEKVDCVVLVDLISSTCVFFLTKKKKSLWIALGNIKSSA